MVELEDEEVLFEAYKTIASIQSPNSICQLAIENDFRHQCHVKTNTDSAASLPTYRPWDLATQAMYQMVELEDEEVLFEAYKTIASVQSLNSVFQLAIKNDCRHQCHNKTTNTDNGPSLPTSSPWDLAYQAM